MDLNYAINMHIMQKKVWKIAKISVNVVLGELTISEVKWMQFTFS